MVADRIDGYAWTHRNPDPNPRGRGERTAGLDAYRDYLESIADLQDYVRYYLGAVRAEGPDFANAGAVFGPIDEAPEFECICMGSHPGTLARRRVPTFPVEHTRHGRTRVYFVGECSKCKDVYFAEYMGPVGGVAFRRGRARFDERAWEDE